MNDVGRSETVCLPAPRDRRADRLPSSGAWQPARFASPRLAPFLLAAAQQYAQIMTDLAARGNQRMSDDHSPGDRRQPYSDRGGPEGRHAETHDVRREELTNPRGPDRAGVE